MPDDHLGMPASTVTIQPRAMTASQTLFCAPDKSLTHRALLFAGMAKGTSTIKRPLTGEDCEATASCLKAMGVNVRKEKDAWIVTSPGVSHWRSPERPLDCGNSGTTARLLTGLLAGLPKMRAELEGDPSLSRRPMGRVVLPLRSMGAHIGGAHEGDRLPLVIEGRELKLCPQKIDKASAQVKSALLLAAMNQHGRIQIELPQGARDHTERLLQKLGANIKVERSSGVEVIGFTGPFQPPALDITVPVDPSSVAFFAVLGVLQKGRVSIKLPDVLQNDTRLGFLRVLQRMASGIACSDADTGSDFMEPVMTMTVTGGSPLKPVNVSAGEVPTLVDEVPVLAVAAAFANGVSRFEGLGELRVKESDRLIKTAELINLMGARAEIHGDDLIVTGGIAIAKALRYDPLMDHRLAMAAAVAARMADGPSIISNPECVAVSFPSFFDLLNKCV